MRRFFLLLLCMLLLLGGCGPKTGESSSSSQQEPEPDVSSSQTEEPQQSQPFSLAAYPSYSFHPALTKSQANRTLAPLLYESLFSLDGSFEPQGVLCQSYSVSTDGLTWTFVLKDGVTFSDGTPLTGETVAQALEVARGAGSQYAGRLSGVAGFSGSGQTVTATLTTPNNRLPALLDIPIALGTGDRPAGTGPYVLTQEGSSLYLTARSDWWQGSASLPVQRIELVSMSPNSDLATAFSSGQITLLDTDLTGSNELGYSGSYQVWDYATTDLVYLGFNTTRGLCQREEVRQAISQAIDRDYVADTVYARHAVATALPFHPDSGLYSQEVAQGLELDLQPLRDLELRGKSITLVVNIEDTAKSAAASSIESQLEQAGLSVTVERLPWEEYTAALAAGNFDLYLAEVYLTADFDLSALVSPTGSLNYGRWQDLAISALLDRLRQAQDGMRQVAADGLSRYLVQCSPIAPICFKNGSVLTQYGRMDGVSPVQNNVFANLSGWTVT